MLALTALSNPVPLELQLTSFDLCTGWLTQWLPASALDEMAEAFLPTDPETLWAAPRITSWPEWHALAECLDVPDAYTIFFGGEEGADGPPLRPSYVAKAKALCARCPVSRDCLTWALEKRELFGIWGGQSGRERERLRRRMRAGETIAEIVDSCLP